MELSDRLSPHFTAWELADHHHDPRLLPPDYLQPNLARLAATVLEPIRVAWGAPIAVVSGYRSQTTNAAVGGAQQSQHLQAKAADITPLTLGDVAAIHEGHATPDMLDKMARFVELVERWVAHDQTDAVGGIGVYASWVHLDIRERVGGHLARWFGPGVGHDDRFPLWHRR